LLLAEKMNKYPEKQAGFPGGHRLYPSNAGQNINRCYCGCDWVARHKALLTIYLHEILIGLGFFVRFYTDAHPRARTYL